MTPATYNFKDQYAGDTFSGVQFTLTRTTSGTTTAINLTGSTITFKLNFGSKSGKSIFVMGVGSGITIVNATSGIFKIDQFAVPAEVGKYFYDVEVKDSSDFISTYLSGTMTVVEQVQ